MRRQPLFIMSLAFFATVAQAQDPASDQEIRQWLTDAVEQIDEFDKKLIRKFLAAKKRSAEVYAAVALNDSTAKAFQNYVRSEDGQAIRTLAAAYRHTGKGEQALRAAVAKMVAEIAKERNFGTSRTATGVKGLIYSPLSLLDVVESGRQALYQYPVLPIEKSWGTWQAVRGTHPKINSGGMGINHGFTRDSKDVSRLTIFSSRYSRKFRTTTPNLRIHGGVQKEEEAAFEFHSNRVVIDLTNGAIAVKNSGQLDEFSLNLDGTQVGTARIVSDFMQARWNFERLLFGKGLTRRTQAGAKVDAVTGDNDEVLGPISLAW